MTMPLIPEYIIEAYSPSKNHSQRELNLMSPAPTTEREARQWAGVFAAKCNTNRLLGATDWQPRIQLVNSQFYARTQ